MASLLGNYCSISSGVITAAATRFGSDPAIDLPQSGIKCPIITCHKDFHLLSQCSTWLHQAGDCKDMSRSVYTRIRDGRRTRLNLWKVEMEVEFLIKMKWLLILLLVVFVTDSLDRKKEWWQVDFSLDPVAPTQTRMTLSLLSTALNRLMSLTNFPLFLPPAGLILCLHWDKVTNTNWCIIIHKGILIAF